MPQGRRLRRSIYYRIQGPNLIIGDSRRASFEASPSPAPWLSDRSAVSRRIAHRLLHLPWATSPAFFALVAAVVGCRVQRLGHQIGMLVQPVAGAITARCPRLAVFSRANWSRSGIGSNRFSRALGEAAEVLRNRPWILSQERG